MEIAANSLDGSVIFHVISEISGFVLHMYGQIPSTLQKITEEFDSLCAKYNDLETKLRGDELKPALRRKHAGEMREAKRGIRRFQKLMQQISDLQTALKLMISDFPRLEEVILVIGGSTLRPQHVYELSFLRANADHEHELDFGKSRRAEVLSKKAVRELILNGAGGGGSAYSGPSKFYLLVKAPASLNLPLHFLPKRDFRFSNKIVPWRLKIKSKTHDEKMDGPDIDSQTGSSGGLVESTLNDFTWFQCRHVIKGLASNTPTEKESE